MSIHREGVRHGGTNALVLIAIALALTGPLPRADAQPQRRPPGSKMSPRTVPPGTTFVASTAFPSTSTFGTTSPLRTTRGRIRLRPPPPEAKPPPAFTTTTPLSTTTTSTSTTSSTTAAPVCNNVFRTLDGSCTSNTDPRWGAVERPQFAYATPRDARVPTGAGLPSARALSNILCAQTVDMPNRRGLTELVTFMGQFLDHSIIGTPVTQGDRFDIPLAPSDPVFANFSGGVLPFERSVREARHEDGKERPINELSSAIDLTAVYGNNAARLTALRTGSQGLLRTPAGDLLPLNDPGLANAPSGSRAFFLAGDVRANENPVLTALHTVFVGEHNRIAKELRFFFPLWDDEALFQHAKLINTALYQKIVYEEFYPAMTGRRLRPQYRGFDPTVDPTVSDVFGASAFRIGHTMVSNQINLRGPGNAPLSPIPFAEMFFRENSIMVNGIEPFLRGAAQHPAQEVDIFVMNSLRNFLFTNVPGVPGLDLMALNIQRGRDHAMPTYNEIRVMFGRTAATSFLQITRNRAVASALHTAYGSVDRVECIIGLFAEKHVRGASMGRTMLKIWRAEFRRLRDGDRFFYQRWEAYPAQLRSSRYSRRLFQMIFGRNTFKKVLLRNTKLTRAELRGSVWVVRV